MYNSPKKKLDYAPKSKIALTTINQAQEWSRQVGRVIPKLDRCHYQKKRAELTIESEYVASALENGGYKAYAKDKLSLVSPLDGSSVSLPNYRHVQIIPLVAWRDATQSKERLEAYFQANSSEALHSAVVSEGYVPVDEYRDSHKSLTKKLATVHLWMRRNGFEPIFYTIERPPFVVDGKSKVNLHAHLLFRKQPNGSLSRLSDYLNRQFHWKSKANPVERDDLQKTIAYLHKQETFSQAKGFDIVTLAKQQEGLCFRQALGSFRCFVSELNASKLRTSRNEDGTFSLVPRYERKKNPFRSGSRIHMNRILRITKPMLVGDHLVQTPAFVVKNYDGNFERLTGSRNIRDFVNRIREKSANQNNKAFNTDSLTTTNRQTTCSLSGTSFSQRKLIENS